jgi:hypothetical protein
MGEKRNCIQDFDEEARRRNHQKDLDVSGKKMFSWTLEK